VIVLGIDIGITGALSAVDSRGTAAIVDLPVVEDAAGKRIAGRDLLNAVRNMAPAGEAALAIIEDVRPRPGPSTAFTMGSLMGSRRAIEAVLDIAGIKVVPVQPQAWKRHFGLLKAEKGASLETARALYPLQAPMLKRQKDHNRAEALLLAHYGQKVKA
jgi:crossover junction endodeoxyribonuclease RuvC